jgi:NADH-quinone oxidoreductase subunit A
MRAHYAGSMHGYYDGYLSIAVLLLIGSLIVGGALLAGRALRPHRPTPEKLTTYECGVDPVGDGWAQTHVRYYVFAYLYAIFAVDAVFLFPWATVFSARGFGPVTLGEMFVFLAFVAAGLAYAWKKGVLNWV